MENLKLFFSKIKELNLWQRLFSWKSVKVLSYDAYEEFRNLESRLSKLEEDQAELRQALTKEATEKSNLEERLKGSELEINKKDGEAKRNAEKVEELNSQLTNAKQKLSGFESTEEERNKSFQDKVTQFNTAQENVREERERLRLQEEKKRIEEFENMKKQWVNHEALVKESIQNVCKRNLIKYVGKVPFKGSPDNTIEIAGEYIVFDSKSPANDDLSNFPTYIKTQTESVKKYANQPSVKRDVFLVVPFNTLDVISQFYFNMGDYNVHVISKDALEPIILSLKKIEEYEFADQLSPEDRDNICRIIGKFAHATKRKIQVDQFFTNQFIEILVKCKNDLPSELLESVIEFEKAEKLNPPTEKRAKQILTKELKEKSESIKAEAGLRQIPIPDSFDDIKKLD